MGFGLIFSVVGGGELLVWALADEADVVDEGGDGGAGKGAEPVHPVVLPDAADHGGAEGDGGVHGGAVEGAAGEDVGADDEADGDGRDDPEVAALGVDGGGVDGVDEAEGHDDLEDHGVPDADAGGEREGAHGLAAGGDLEEEAGHDGAEQLRHPVHHRLEEADVAAHEGAECDGRVHVAARDVGAHGDGHEERERVRQRRRDQPRRRRRAAVSQLACQYGTPCKTGDQHLIDNMMIGGCTRKGRKKWR
uniref:Uncharacterized protein n=1 Tax=Aegilops tauschii subsp. strangulata TaxID=200361 RepID=A0A453GY14_AEGTS